MVRSTALPPPTSRRWVTLSGSPRRSPGFSAFEAEAQQNLYRERFTEITPVSRRSSGRNGSPRTAARGRSVVPATSGSPSSTTLEAEVFVVDDTGKTQVGPAVRLFSPTLSSVASGHAGRVGGKCRRRTTSVGGVAVVDLAIILAGPTCGRLLGELGADVVKIDAPGPD